MLARACLWLGRARPISNTCIFLGRLIVRESSGILNPSEDRFEKTPRIDWFLNLVVVVDGRTPYSQPPMD